MEFYSISFIFYNMNSNGYYVNICKRIQKSMRYCSNWSGSKFDKSSNRSFKITKGINKVEQWMLGREWRQDRQTDRQKRGCLKWTTNPLCFCWLIKLRATSTTDRIDARHAFNMQHFFFYLWWLANNYKFSPFDHRINIK